MSKKPRATKRPSRGRSYTNSRDLSEMHPEAMAPKQFLDDPFEPIKKLVQAVETTRAGLTATAGEFQQTAERMTNVAEKMSSIAAKLDLVADGLNIVLEAPVLRRFRSE